MTHPLPEDDTEAALLLQLCDCFRLWMACRHPENAPPDEPQPRFLWSSLLDGAAPQTAAAEME